MNVKINIQDLIPSTIPETNPSTVELEDTYSEPPFWVKDNQRSKSIYCISCIK